LRKVRKTLTDIGSNPASEERQPISVEIWHPNALTDIALQEGCIPGFSWESFRLSRAEIWPGIQYRGCVGGGVVMLKKFALSLLVGTSFLVVGSLNPVHAQGEKSATKRPHMDLAFCIDTTGSMQAEIDMVKTKTKELVAKLSSGKPAPIVRVGLVAYRDQGDAYVTKVFPFTDDIDKVVKDISDLRADGGGDGPEAVDRGLHVALKDLNWDSSKHTAKLLFLIGDAGPHGAPTDLDWRKDCREAIANGVQINTIGCSGLESYPAKQGVDVFKQIAQLTDGKYDTLAYRQEIVDASGHHETLVSSGGAVFRMKSRAPEWKKAVAAGAMDKLSPADSATAVAAAAPMSALSGMAMSAPGAAPMSAMAKSSRAAGFSGSKDMFAGAAVGGAVSRSDNNLDDIMLRAALQKAEKSLNVGY
jgi:Mg-chelatase subunit ChlD